MWVSQARVPAGAYNPLVNQSRKSPLLTPGGPRLASLHSHCPLPRSRSRSPPQRTKTRTMPQHTANSNQQRGQDFNRPWATNAASSSSGGALTQPRDEAAPARLRMACGDCCLPSCYVKERVKMAFEQKLDVATSGEYVVVKCTSAECPMGGQPRT